MFKAGKHSPLRIFILVALFAWALAAGYAGSKLARFEQEARLEQMRPVIFEDRTKTSESRESVMQDVWSDVHPSILSLYSAPQKPSSVQDELLVASQLRGFAVALTSDGWLATSVRDGKDSLVAIDGTKAVFRPEKILNDPATGLWFLKIKAMNLKPINLGDIDGVLPQEGYLVRPSSIDRISLSMLGYGIPTVIQDTIRSSALLEKRLNPDQRYAESGLPVSNGAKEVIGLATERGILPISYMRASFRDVLKNGAIARPRLPIRYTDLSHVERVSTSKDEKSGARVVAEKYELLTTPTGTEKLYPGDLIIGVNDEDVNGNRSLSELLHQYKPGETVILKIRHGSSTRLSKIRLQS